MEFDRWRGAGGGGGGVDVAGEFVGRHGHKNRRTSKVEATNIINGFDSSMIIVKRYSMVVLN